MTHENVNHYCDFTPSEPLDTLVRQQCLTDAQLLIHKLLTSMGEYTSWYPSTEKSLTRVFGMIQSMVDGKAIHEREATRCALPKTVVHRAFSNASPARMIARSAELGTVAIVVQQRPSLVNPEISASSITDWEATVTFLPPAR